MSLNLQSTTGLSTQAREAHYRIKYNGARTLQVIGDELDSGRTTLIIPFTSVSGIETMVGYPNCSLDFDYTSLDVGNNRGGLVDGIAVAANSQYHVWALSSWFYNALGFVLTAIPKSSHTMAGATNKGATGVFTVINKAYRFTPGARVRVIQVLGAASTYIGEWNLGTIASVDSTTQITVNMDNNANYGTNLATTGAGVSIEQLDRFKPYLIDDSDQGTIAERYKIIGLIETDASANVNRVFRYPLSQYMYSNYTRILWNLTSNVAVTTANPLLNSLIYVPEDTLEVYIRILISGASGTEFIVLDNSDAGTSASYSGASTTQNNTVHYWYPLNNATRIIYLRYSDGGTNTGKIISLLGWRR